MHPELFRIGPLVINSYGIMLALAFLVGLWITIQLGKKRGLDPDTITNLAVVIMLSSIFGARLLYVLFHLNEFRGRWIYTFVPIQPDGTIGLGGLILLGGVIAAFIAGTWYVHKKQLPFWKIADSVAPALAIGLFFGRIGCFLNGCCFGKACDLPWGVVFPENSPAGYVFRGIPVHPTQLYSSLYGLVIFLILIFWERRQPFDGFLFALFLILYGIARFTVDFFRYYESQMFILAGLDFNQVVSLIMVLSGIGILYYRARAKLHSE